ncbi:MAG: ABC transporter permease [Chitinophagaceae bacterium]|nr:ABC transporter permease [Chitinophagaceae bacterium]
MTDKSIESNEVEHWDIVIEPHAHLFDLKMKEVWHYRDLLLLLVRRDFVSFYKQTILGPLWFFVQPLFTTIIYTFIFNSLAAIKTDNIPAPLFYIAGITAWNYFSDCLTKTSTVFKDNSNVFGKVYFPRLIMPLSIVISNLIRFAVQMLLFIIMMAYYGYKGYAFHLNEYALLFPVLVLLMALLGLGAGMIISALTTKYRDLAFLVTFGVQLLMYTTTVVYPLSEAVKKYPKYELLFSLNPMTPIIETFRFGFFGQGSFSWMALGICSAVTLCITFFGIIIFNRVEKTFIDTV